MALTPRAYNSNNTVYNAASTTGDARIPADVALGDLLVMLLTRRATASEVSAPPGWSTATGADADANNSFVNAEVHIGKIFYKTADSTDVSNAGNLLSTFNGTWTFSPAATRIYQTTVIAIPGAATPPVNVLEVHTNAQADPTPWIAPTVTPDADGLHIVMFANGSPARSYSTPSTYSVYSGNLQNGTANADRIAQEIFSKNISSGVATGNIETTPSNTNLVGASGWSLVIEEAALTTEVIVPSSISGSLVGFTAGGVGDIDELTTDATDSTWLTAPNPDGVSTNTGFIRPTAHAAVSGFAGEFATQANAYDTSTTTAATSTMATASSNYGNYFSFGSALSSIPDGSTITGIEIEVTDQVGTNNRSDQFYQVGTANGTLVGSEFQLDATTTKQTRTVTHANLGSPSLTAAQVKASTFGIRVRTLRSNTVTLSLFDLRVRVTYTPPGSTTATEVDAIMGNPATPIVTGAGTGKIRIRVRKKGSGTNPNVVARIRDDAGNLLLDNAIPSTAVSTTATNGTVIESATFNQNVLTAGKDSVMIEVASAGAAGGLVEVGAINWVAGVVSPVSVPLLTGIMDMQNGVPLQGVGLQHLMSTADLVAEGVALAGIDPGTPSGGVNVPLDTADLVAEGVNASLAPGPLGVPLDTADLTAAAQNAAIQGGPLAVALATAISQAQGQAITPVRGPLSVPLDTADVAASPVNLTAVLGGPFALSLDTADLTAEGQDLASILGGPLSVPLDTADLTAQGNPITISIARIVQLSTATLTAQGQNLQVIPGARSVPLLTATLTAEGQDITISAPGAGAVVVPLDTAVLTMHVDERLYPEPGLFPEPGFFPGRLLGVTVLNPGAPPTVVPLDTAELQMQGIPLLLVDVETPDERRIVLAFDVRRLVLKADNRGIKLAKESRRKVLQADKRRIVLAADKRRLKLERAN